MNSYLLFKSLHLIAVISWMAGLLYLPRIFVYHVENLEDKNTNNNFSSIQVAERTSKPKEEIKINPNIQVKIIAGVMM